MTILLHGFWGQPLDWNAVLRELPLTASVLTPDLYENGKLSPEHELGGHWEENFLNYLDLEAGAEPVDLVGYSMGARLALNAYMKNPKRFRRVLLMSGGPAMGEAEVRGARELWEQGWSEKFRTQPWQELESQWQDQPIFQADQKLKRRRSDDLRVKLGQSLENWSIRRHPFTWPSLKELPASVEWAYGALDQKYLNFAKSLQDLPVQGQISIIPNAGHRILSDAPKFIARWIDQ